MQKLPWGDALFSGSLHQTGKDTVGFQSAFRSGSETDLAEDHQIPEGLFREIVCGRYARAPEEGEEKCLFGSCEKGPEGLCGFETKCLFADVVELRDGAFFDLAAAFQGRSPDFSFCPVSQSREPKSMTWSQKGPTAASFSVWGRSACSLLISLALVMMWAMQTCQSTPIPL